MAPSPLPLLLLALASRAVCGPQMEQLAGPLAGATGVIAGARALATEVGGYLPGGSASVPYRVLATLGPPGLEEREYPASRWVCSSNRRSSLCGCGEEQRGELLARLTLFLRGANSGSSSLLLHRPLVTTVTPVEDQVERRVFARRLGGWMEEEDWEEEKEDLAVTLESLGEEVTRGEGRVEVEYQGRLKFWNRRNEIWLMRSAGGRGVLG